MQKSRYFPWGYPTILCFAISFYLFKLGALDGDKTALGIPTILLEFGTLVLMLITFSKWYQLNYRISRFRWTLNRSPDQTTDEIVDSILHGLAYSNNEEGFKKACLLADQFKFKGEFSRLSPLSEDYTSSDLWEKLLKNYQQPSTT